MTSAATKSHVPPQPVRSAFTLVELLVVIGIIALLVAILLPSLRRARIAAYNTVCASRLEQIAVASSAYLVDYHQYPLNYVNDPYNFVYPHDQQSRTLNELSDYLGRFPPITDATNEQDLPHPLVCPFAEMWEGTGRKWVGNGNTYWYTGYAYYARLDEDPNYTDTGGVHHQTGRLLMPDHAANARGTRRAVLYGDAIVWFGYVGGNGMWYYTHVKGSIHPNGSFVFWHDATDAFAGRHLAYTDGSVVWDNGSEINLDLTQRDQTAAYTDGGLYYWWF